MGNILTKSDDMSTEYCISIVKIGEISPVENSDFLGKVIVNGRDIIIRKDDVKEGDVMFYASNESQLNSDFLSINNLFEISCYELNDNADLVKQLILENRNDEAKTMVGYFDKNGRVRMKRLRGTLSMGFLFGLDTMTKWCPMLLNFNMDEHIGEDFDTVNGELFVKAYMPPVKENPHCGLGKGAKLERKANRFDKMVPGQFAFHYHTEQLNKEMYRLKPSDVVTISVKRHGTSIIIGNILTRQPLFGGKFKEYFNRLPKFLQFTKKRYDIVYSSRTVIKNKFINENVTEGFYGKDVWAEYYTYLKDYIPQGYTIYGEICGYVGGSNSFIQKGYDYRCKPGENNLMIYRISKVEKDGKKTELNVMEVYSWTLELMQQLCDNNLSDIALKIHPIDILYHGKMKDLYPNIEVNSNWHQNVLEAMKNDSERFGMEKNEPLCRNIVAREGIVLRIDDDVINEAFKLKTLKFLDKEAKDMDKGITSDIEMIEGYGG